MGVASLRQPLQLLHGAVPVLQRKCLVPDDLPQFPAIIGLSPQPLRFVMVAQVSVLEGDLPQTDALRLLDDSVLDLPELLLLGQLFSFSGLIVVVVLYLTLEDAPLVVAGFHYWYLLQLVYDFVHGFLYRLGEIAIGLLALDGLQLSGQLFHLLLDLRVRADTSCHLLCEFSDSPACLPHQLIPRLRLLLVGVEHLLLEDLIGQLRLDFVDAFQRQVFGFAFLSSSRSFHFSTSSIM